MEILIAITAILGAALGIFNTYQNYKKEKIRLEVKSIWGKPILESYMLMTMIINHSSFPIQISSISLILFDGKIENADVPFVDGSPVFLPVEIKERNNLIVGLPSKLDSRMKFKTVKKVCVLTANGKSFYGKIENNK